MIAEDQLREDFERQLREESAVRHLDESTGDERPVPPDEEVIEPSRPKRKKVAKVEPAMPVMVDAADLTVADMPEPTFIARPWIAEGLTLVVGPPKIGKTTLLRQLAHACRTAGHFLTSPCSLARVLFLSLEEGERPMRAKLKMMGVPTESLRGVALAFEWPQAQVGVELLRQWMKAHVAAGEMALIVIDCLQRFRAAVDQRANAYAQDYEALKMLADLGKEFPGLCVLVLHHTRKATTDDPLAAVSGTNGLAAATENYLILQRVGEKFRLTAGGRLWMGDADQFEVVRAAKGSAWTLAGEWNTDAAELPTQQRMVYELLLDGAKATKTLAEMLGKRADDLSGLRHLLGKLKDQGLVRPVANGWEVVR